MSFTNNAIRVLKRNSKMRRKRKDGFLNSNRYSMNSPNNSMVTVPEKDYFTSNFERKKKVWISLFLSLCFVAVVVSYLFSKYG